MLRRSDRSLRVYPIVAEMGRCRAPGGQPLDVIAADTAAEISLMWLAEVVAFGRLQRIPK